MDKDVLLCCNSKKEFSVFTVLCESSPILGAEKLVLFFITRCFLKISGKQHQFTPTCIYSMLYLHNLSVESHICGIYCFTCVVENVLNFASHFLLTEEVVDL